VRDVFVDRRLRPGLTARERIRARELLEMARDGLRMFTSCAWFFDDLTGLEAAQNLRYAARAIELAGPPGFAMEAELMAQLRLSHSSDPGSVTAEQVWAREVQPIVPPLARLAGGVAAASTCVPDWSSLPTPAFDIAVNERRVTLKHRRTGREFVFDVSVAMQGLASVHAYVRARSDFSGDGAAELPAGTVPVDLEDFPEREQAAVRDAVRVPRRRELARHLLGSETLTRVAHGDITLIDATVEALMRELSGMATDPSPARAACASEMIDLIELLGRNIPFDVQTTFATALAHLPPAKRSVFADLAARLGFAPEILAATDLTP
jgi:hypothetical protein